MLLRRVCSQSRQGVRHSHFDAIIIGGGHNGLTCANYLAKKNLRVCVLENRDIIGGAAVTEEFHKGYRNSMASYAVSLLSPQIIADLELHHHGLRVVERPMGHFVPLLNGQYLLTGDSNDPGLTKREIAKFSEKDAAVYDRYNDMLESMTDTLRTLSDQPPPNLGGGLQDLFQALKVGGQLRKLNRVQQRDFLDMFTKSCGEILDFWFESEPLKGMLAFDAVTGNFQSPYTPGSAYVLLHHLFGEVNGKKGKWGHAMGGMGAITQAMAKSAVAKGVEIRLNSRVTEVLLEGGRAVGVVVCDARTATSPLVGPQGQGQGQGKGKVLRARVLASNLHPKTLFERLLPAPALNAVDPDFLRRIRAYKSHSGTFRMNVALSELPNFTCAPTTTTPGRTHAHMPHHTSGIFITPSMRYLDTAWHEALRDGWSSRPVIEMQIPSTIDPSLVPPGSGHHVASLFCQHFQYNLPNGQSWDDPGLTDRVADVIIDTVNAYAPNFKKSVLGRVALSPLGLERKFGLVGGDIFHGTLSLDQLYSARPVLGHGAYRSPIPGLYMCGSGTHPGGGVSGRPGRNAAVEILRDLGAK